MYTPNNLQPGQSARFFGKKNNKTTEFNTFFYRQQPFIGIKSRLFIKVKMRLTLPPLRFQPYIHHYNNERTHKRKRCQGRTPMATFIEGKNIYNDKNLDSRLAA